MHYGKEIVRFTIYCRHDNYADILKFYELILKRSPSQKKADFCIFPIFSNLDNPGSSLQTEEEAGLP